MRVFKIVLAVFTVSMVMFSLVVLMPRTYAVPEVIRRTDIRYWDLATGSRIAYTLVPAVGDRKPYPIIFLQGGPGGHISERNVALFSEFARDGYDVYLYDQIGGGFSARLDDITAYTIDRHVQDLDEIIKKTGAEKVILIGQSWGAMLATMYIADHGEKVAKAIFTGPGPILPLNVKLTNISAPDSIGLRTPVVTNADGNAKVQNLRTRFTEFVATSYGVKLASDKEADAYQTYLNSQLNKSTVCDTSKAPGATSGDGYYAQVMTVYSFHAAKDPRDKLKKSKVPLRIMRGQCDNQRWGFTSEYLELFSDHQLVVIEGAGHAISVEQPELYKKTMRDFLSK